MGETEVAPEGARWRRTARRVTVASVALIVAYAVVPVHFDDDTASIVVGATVTVIAIAVLVVVTRRMLRHQRDNPEAPLGGLAVAIVGDVLVWSLVDYAIAYHFPSQFDGLATRVDALYFAVATLLTVGFGDIAAHGQFARMILIGQMAFNILFITTSATILVRRLERRSST